MLTLLAKQQTSTITVYLNTDTISVRQLTPYTQSYIFPDTVNVKFGIPPIQVYDNTLPPEPFVYVDGGLYNEEGIIADAEYYNTTYWSIVWNGGYP